MESNDDRNLEAINASVGRLVWVRRRNGSWWPGQTLVHDQVPDNSLVAPKVGTPIKLLGRDDVSVDWYILENSKTVKAFRCGEYDTCIEKAKASSSKKRSGKCTLREDAINNALKIENEHLAKEDDNLCNLSGEEDSKRCLSGKEDEDSGSSDAEETEDDELASAPEQLQSSISSQEMNNVGASKVQSKRRRTPNDSEDDGTQTNKRMRGLEDIGMGTGSKGKVQVGALLEDTQENGFKSDTNNINDSVSNGSLSNGSSRDCSPSMKRKRSPVVIANDYSKRKNRRRTLTKVLESTATVSIPGTCDKLVNSDCLSLPGVSESDNNSDSNEVFSENVSENIVEVINDKGKESEVSNISVLAKDDSSNGLFDVPLNGDEKYPSGISTVPFTSSSPRKALVSGPTRRFGQSSHDDVVKSEGSNGSPSTSPAATLFNGIKKSTSKWQLKGKRNSRQMSKKQVERRNAYAEEANNNALPHWSVSDQKPRSLFSVGTQAMGRNSELYDVKIEVKANYKPRNVPLISLRSKLNGEAIVGHPSVVEVLEDGSCGHIVSSHRIDDAKPKPSSKKKSKKKKPHFPPQASKSKKSSSLAIKTRCLSALSGQKLTLSSKKKVMIESTKERIVACIPLKVVFSRINEAVKGSARQVHRSLPSAGNTG